MAALKASGERILLFCVYFLLVNMPVQIKIVLLLTFENKLETGFYSIHGNMIKKNYTSKKGESHFDSYKYSHILVY